MPKFATGKLGRDGETSYFVFKTHVFADPIEVRWPTGNAFVIIDPESATAMLNHGFATNISDEQLERYMLEYETRSKDGKKAKGSAPDFVPPAAPVPDFVPPAAPLAPAANAGDSSPVKKGK